VRQSRFHNGKPLAIISTPDDYSAEIEVLTAFDCLTSFDRAGMFSLSVAGLKHV